MRQEQLTLAGCRPVARDVYELRLEGVQEKMAPGQFVNVSVPGFSLRRPISVCNQEGPLLTLVVRAQGKGTQALVGARPGTKLDVLTGLGHGYSLEKAGDSPLLIGGGVGVPPLFYLARMLRRDRPVAVCMGFNRKEDVFYAEEFEKLGCEVRIATMDGSLGTKGLVTQTFPQRASFFYACGPMPMLKALSRAEWPGEVSLEARMGCGFGACMGCSLRTKSGMQRICREGPVFAKEEILWED